MKLLLYGSRHRYALDQLAIAMFPDEKHSFEESDPAEDQACCTVSKTERSIFVNTTVVLQGVRAYAEAVYDICKSDSAQFLDIQEKQLIKKSFYLACVKATKTCPDWGCLSGVRPAKLARLHMESGKSLAEVYSLLHDEYFVVEKKSDSCSQSGKNSL